MESIDVLFIQGFATCCDENNGSDNYANIRLYFRGNPRYEVTYFSYDTHEAVADVERRLRETIDTVKPAVLIGHSMGGYLAMNHLRMARRQFTDTSTYVGHIPARYILLMPFLESSPLLNFAASLHLPEFVRRLIEIPSGFIFPAENSHDQGNLLNTSFRPICFRQPLEIHPVLPRPAELRELFDTDLADLRVVFSVDEAVTAVGADIISHIPREKISYTYGKHSAFRSVKTDFFDVLERLLGGVPPPTTP
jgi:pimeloyl-ACP methyl ester carboxylesterase